MYEIFPKIYGESSTNGFVKFPIFRKYSPKYDGESSTIYGKYSTSLLGNYPQYLRKFHRILRNIPQGILRKITSNILWNISPAYFSVICVTKILGKIFQKFFYSDIKGVNAIFLNILKYSKRFLKVVKLLSKSNSVIIFINLNQWLTSCFIISHF